MKWIIAFFVFFFSVFSTISSVHATPAMESDVMETVDLKLLQLKEVASYTCEYTATFTGTVDIKFTSIEVDLTCTGTGTSDVSAEDACDKAKDVLEACVTVWM